MDLLQTQDSLDGIRNLIEAAQASRNVHSQSNRWQQAIDEELESLAEFKAFYTSLRKDDRPQVGLNQISSLRLRLDIDSARSQDQPRAFLKSDNVDDEEEKEVWINWQSRHSNVGELTSKSIALVEELTILLMARKMPDEFCIPPCLGYSILQWGKEEARPALIFENPEGVGPQVRPMSLLQALELHRKPSLTQRVVLAQRIAQCLLYLHTVDWLHKALRSSNIVFFPSSEVELNVHHPYLTGFDHSRRSRFDETSQVPHVGRMEIYRHPAAQVRGPKLEYRKTFDIYSLGLVLAEIALWEPIMSIMNMETTDDPSPPATRGVRERWLASEPRLLESVQAEVGDRYAGAVEACLKGGEAYGITAHNIETSSDTGRKIQRGFSAKVVRPLAEILI